MRTPSWCFVLICCVVCAVCAESEEVFPLVRDGAPACTIVVSQHPTPAARLASLELQCHVLAITGAELPIRTDAEPVTGPRVLVGESEATHALGFRSADFAPQEYLIAFRKETIILIGRDWEETEANRAEPGRPMSCGDTLDATRQHIDYWKI